MDTLPGHDKWMTLSLEPPFWSGFDAERISGATTFLGWLAIFFGAGLWIGGSTAISMSVGTILDVGRNGLAASSAGNYNFFLFLIGMIVFFLSVPLIRLIPWFFSPAFDAMGTRSHDSTRNFAIFIGLVISIFSIVRVAAVGLYGDGFAGPLDIALPVVLVIYYFAVFSVMQIRLDL